MIRVLSITLESLDNDSRILKTIGTLQCAGYTVEAVSNCTTQRTTFVNFDIDFAPASSGLMARLNSVFRAAKIARLVWRMRWRHYSVIHCNDLPALPVGIALALGRRTRIVYDAHELETQRNGLKRLRKRFYNVVERACMPFVARVITVSPSIAEEYRRLYPRIDHPAVVLNTPPYSKITDSDLFRQQLNIGPESPIFLYQGGIIRGRAIPLILETFAQLEENSVTLVLLGNGALAPLADDYAERHQNIYRLPAVSPDVLPRYTASADYGLCLIENTCLSYYYCLPNKLFEYLMAGLPVIVSNLYELPKCVVDGGLGVVSQENSIEGLAQTIRQIQTQNRQEMVDRVRRFCQRHNWERQEEVLLALYRELVCEREEH